MSHLFLLGILACLILSAATIHGNAIAPAVPGPDDRCPVCGTLVQPHQAWLAQVRYADGSTVFFDGAKDLFRYLEAPEKYSKDKQGTEIAAIFVTTWSDHEVIPLDRAWFVIGSDVRGPAGDELIPLRDIEKANGFIIEHGGTRLVQADDVSTSVLAQLP